MMSSVPMDRIFDLRNKIHENTRHVHANKIQCQRLCQRIDQLIDPLERLEHATSMIVRDETRLILVRLLECIDDCNNYIEKLKSSEHWYEEIYEYKKSEEKFRELNKSLSEIGQDLSLGLNIQQLFDRKQDQEDQREDIKELHEKIDEISQKMLEKQCQQYQLIDKKLDKRFQSFRLYFIQSLSLHPDPKHQQFLHIPYKDLAIDDQPLGHGGFADVYKGIWLTHHDQVAIKKLRLNYLSDIQNDFYREISTMYRIRYENILSVLGACVEPNFYAIIVEYMPLGSLADILYKKRSEEIHFDWFDRYSIAWQMAKSINYLHNLNPSILHRDIKSMNFLLKYNGPANHKYLVKVCDFGLAEIRREITTQSASFPSYQIVGSFYWKAPELLIPHSRHTKQSDVYSLGMVFWELGTERKPWDEYEDETIILIHLKTGVRPTIPSDIPERYKQLIEDAWNHDPQKRPTCFQLMERIHKELNSSDQPTMIVNEKDIIDLHPQEIESEKFHSVPSITTTDSTRTAIEVVEEKLVTDSLPTKIIPSEMTTDHPDSELTIKHSASCSSLNTIESQNPVTPSFERTLSKSVEDISPSSKTENEEAQNSVHYTPLPLYRIEKRRSLHNKSIWTGKKDNA